MKKHFKKNQVKEEMNESKEAKDNNQQVNMAGSHGEQSKELEVMDNSCGAEGGTTTSITPSPTVSSESKEDLCTNPIAGIVAKTNAMIKVPKGNFNKTLSQLNEQKEQLKADLKTITDQNITRRLAVEAMIITHPNMTSLPRESISHVLRKSEDNDDSELVVEERDEIDQADTSVKEGPQPYAKLRILDFDESVTSQDVAKAIATVVGCNVAEVCVSKVKRSSRRQGSAYACCPLVKVHKLRSKPQLVVGWNIARVLFLGAKRLRCHQCLQLGHKQNTCTAETDLSLLCYRCSQEGHWAENCRAKKPKCPLCSTLGRSAKHSLGEHGCQY